MFRAAVAVSTLLALGAVPSPARAQAAAPAEWTFMVYMDADCNLEDSTMMDLEEMVAAGSTPQVQVVALVDRAAAGEEEDGYTNRPVANLRDWKTAKLLHVQKGSLRELADWGEVDMAEGATLRRFVETVKKDFPARHYALVVGDHGAAWPGAVADDSSAKEGDLLTLDELRAALTPALAGQPLDLIGFDACLMGNYETAESMAPLARTLVASEELEPGTGWEYTTPLRALASRPTMTGAELGRAIADAFHTSYERGDEDMRDAAPGITLAVVALDHMAGLETAVNGLADALAKSLAQGGRAAWLKLAEARTRAESYGTLGDPQAPQSGLHDLRDLTHHLSTLAPDPAVRTAAAAVEKAVGETVIHAVRGRARPAAHGLSIYFPRDAKTLAARQPLAYGDLSVASSGRWLPFLKSFAGVTDADHESPGLGDTGASGRDVSADHPIELHATVKADDLDEAYFVLEEAQGEHSYVIGQMLVEPDDKGKLEESWDGDWFTIGTGKQRVVCPITNMEPADDEEDVEDDGGAARSAAAKPAPAKSGFSSGVTDAGANAEEESEEPAGNGWFIEVPVEITRKGREQWNDAWLYFYVDFEADEVKGEFVYAFLDTEDGPREIPLKAGDRLRPVYVHVDADGEEDYVVSEAPEDVITLARGARDLDVQMSRVTPGDYHVGFVVWDYAGNVTEHISEVTVR